MHGYCQFNSTQRQIIGKAIRCTARRKRGVLLVGYEPLGASERPRAPARSELAHVASLAVWQL